MKPSVIEQTAEQARLAFEFHTHAEIHSIRLRKARLVSEGLPGTDSGPIELRLARKARRVEAPEGIVRLEIDFRVEGRKGSGASGAGPRKSGLRLLLVECTWEADYLLAEGYQPAPETISAFKDGNAIFNCWPYFREFVQSAVARMNLPPLTLPLLRLLPKRPAREQPGSRQQIRESRRKSRPLAPGRNP
jgi:hypothetical protein